jgi:2-amino-4-hydroxy-6-hydroxymethyldihydropteridine diphosphokinase
MPDIVVGVGANLGDPAAAFDAARSRLADRSEIAASSRLWRTRPVGPPQPDYLNAAVVVAWPEHPLRLLELCYELEAEAGRDRSSEVPWGPRVLDLDLLIARNTVIRSPALELPHHRFHERAFALVPAAEVAPDWIHPVVGRTLSQLAADAHAADPDALISSETWRSD